MVYDLLSLKGNVYNYEIETEGGKSESKSHILDERDSIWVELRHQHFAAASLRISSMLDDFRKKNKAASYIRNKGGAVRLFHLCIILGCHIRKASLYYHKL